MNFKFKHLLQLHNIIGTKVIFSKGVDRELFLLKYFFQWLWAPRAAPEREPTQPREVPLLSRTPSRPRRAGPISSYRK